MKKVLQYHKPKQSVGKGLVQTKLKEVRIDIKTVKELGKNRHLV